MFNGRYNDRLFKEYSYYLTFITDFFLVMVDSENGNFLHMPFEGSIADQPYITMNYLKFIQGLYRKHLAEQNKIRMKGKKR